MPNAGTKPLRILIVVNLNWDPRLGAVRVYLELAERWRAAGHTVEKFSLSEAFPKPHGSRAGFAVRQFLFSYKAVGFVRHNANRFDIVDAIIGALPVSKRRLGFSGLLVARSVGLYRLYERFERIADKRWPRRARGNLLGTVLYTLFRHWRMRTSDRSVRHADLINVPNESEAGCLRDEVDTALPIVVKPYGLTQDRRIALHDSAASTELRLTQRRISFIGMWGARKGARDWPQIIRAIWRKVPEAQFRFLGTMVESREILADLGTESRERIELVSDYDHVDLAALLADCTVGAFPSYAEGFGLGVIEQLAAGIPTVAFDVAGPRDILDRKLSELLVPAGDVERFADAICQILALDPKEYGELSKRSVETASTFDWSKIADETLNIYRSELDRIGEILFVQPFSLGAAGGGGGRILRALLQDAPMAWHSACCSPRRPKPWPNETHLPTRPSWGKIETSRYSMFPKRTMSIFAGGFRRRLKAFCRQRQARAIHTVPHSGLDFAYVQAVARELSIPFFISLHDDLAYTSLAEIGPALREPAMRTAWLEADARFVISDALGREYSTRYGERPYQIVTDGLARLNSCRSRADENIIRIYFMGLFHLAYERNLRALLEAIVLLEQEQPGLRVTVTCRCEFIRPHVWKDIKPVNVLPFSDEAQIERDMQDADFLYMPMPFGAEHENFARYSVSTKMVTYVGSGLPILYHGPTASAAFDLLQRNQAAILLTTLEPKEIAKKLAAVTEPERARAVGNALTLAQHDFMLADQTRKFWGTISSSMATK